MKIVSRYNWCLQINMETNKTKSLGRKNTIMAISKKFERIVH